jgi:tRNA dimethylallyltransferase
VIRVAAIVGPTAVGKSAIGLEVARRLEAEIVSIDSMQIYRGMNIGTDKATDEMREVVAHHLLDVRDPTDDVTVADFQGIARAAISEISARGRLPLLVGGSGLYFRAVVDDLHFPPRDERVRQALQEDATQNGPAVLHERLMEVDPVAAARIEPGNTRRLVRALEVISLTKRPYSDNDVLSRHESIYTLAAAGLTRTRSDLYDRIVERVRSMLEAGLVEEVCDLYARGLARTPSQALGYRQVLAEPLASSDELGDVIVRATKRFARRQESWFRSDPRVRWFDAAQPGIGATLESFFRSRLPRGPGTH